MVVWECRVCRQPRPGDLASARVKAAAWQSPVGKVDTGVQVAASAASQESVSRGYGGGVT